MYTCVVENQFGTVRVSAFVTVTGIGPYIIQLLSQSPTLPPSSLLPLPLPHLHLPPFSCHPSLSPPLDPATRSGSSREQRICVYFHSQESICWL